MMRYLRVSWLRRSMKLQVVHEDQVADQPRIADDGMEAHVHQAALDAHAGVACSGDLLYPLAAEVRGKRVVRRTTLPETHQAMATMRSSCTVRSKMV